MRLCCLFLLVYLLGSCLGSSHQQGNTTCDTRETCHHEPDPTSNFLQCVGLHSADTGRDHMRNLKRMLEATMDVYTFMRSSMKGVPLLHLEGWLELDPKADPLQNEDLVRMWMQVKIKPLLKSITKHFLACLSTKNFSCSTYHTVVQELSLHFSEMDPVRQKWIYTFFMYPFLSGYGVSGCVKPDESSEEWLMKNFGAFRVMARMKDLSTLNVVFSGLEVLHLLSPSQKAELLLRPEVAGLNNDTLSLVFHSLLTGGAGPHPTMGPGGSHNWTSPGYPPAYSHRPTHDPYLPPSPHSSLREVVNGVMVALRPVGSFVHNFVSFTHERDVSQIRSSTLAQFLLNWTLAELANMYQPPETPGMVEFDVMNLEDWYKHVVMPVLRRFLPNDQALMNEKIMLAFHEVFYLDHAVDNQTEIQDVCSITLDISCGLTDAVQNVAQVLHCAARSNLTMSETTIMRLIEELTGRLSSLLTEFSTANFSQVASDFQQIFSEADSPSLTHHHLEDPDFIKLWYQIKLMPLLPDVPTALLSCLSTKNFSCPVYQTIVGALSKHMSVMDADPYSQNIYKHFIYSFLLHHNTSDPRCVSSANHSAEWLMKNVGFFYLFASITDFYELNPNFSGLDVLHILTPRQTAELLLLPLRTPPEKDVVIDTVFDFLLNSPEHFVVVLQSLVQLVKEINPPCAIYKHILERLYSATLSLPPHLETFTWTYIDKLIDIAPKECLMTDITCPVIQVNATNVCRGIDSSDLHLYLSNFMDVPCNFSLETYACSQLENFTAGQLVSLLKCHLPGNSSQSKVLWKVLLTKLSPVLNAALDMLADMSGNQAVPSASVVLDVIGDLRLSMLTDEQLRNSSVIMKWFSGRLSGFLPMASGGFLRCLSWRNLSCHSYQQILQVLSRHFDDMTMKQQHVVLEKFILSFLSEPHTGPACVSGSNSSAEWLQENLGPFSVHLSIEEMLHLNPEFKPLDALRQLTPKQFAELLVMTLPTLPGKEVIIHVLFDYLTESSQEDKLPEFLSNLIMFLPHGNLSCSAYRTLFTRLDLALPVVSLQVASAITYSKMVLSNHIPPGCSINGGECRVTSANETVICAGVNSTRLQLHLDNGTMEGHFCGFAIEDFACASLEALTAQDLVNILTCDRSASGSRAVWKLLLSKASRVLDEALDLLTNMTLNSSNPAVALILDSIQEVRLDSFSSAFFNDPAFIRLWFNHRLRPFLPAVSPHFLSCLTTKALTCNSYQNILQTLSVVQRHMKLNVRISVYTHFIKIFLMRNNTADPSCSVHSNNSGQWLQRNFGAFSTLVSFHDLQMLYSNFSAMEALGQLTVRQLAEVSSTPGQLTDPDHVTMVMEHIPNQHLVSFFDDFSPAIMGHEAAFPSPVRSAMLQVVFDRANLSDHSVDDTVVSVWLHNRLGPLLVELSPAHVAPFFKILGGRSCSIEQQGVEDLNLTISTLGGMTQKEIHNHIVQTLKGPTPLRCYGDNYNHSFYRFLENTFMGFKVPRLTVFLSLMPHNQMHQLVNSMPPSDLGDFLRQPDIVDSDLELCTVYANYMKTPVFLEMEALPAEVQRPTLPCVWPMALSSSERSEVNAWFDRRLNNYLVFLTKSLLSPNTTYNASCLAFQKLVVILSEYRYDAADFGRQDVFDTIRAYLTSETVRCYNPDEPELNSTAWFAEYIGPFIQFLTLQDLLMFGSTQDIQVFTVNHVNLQLLNDTPLPLDFISYYTELVYTQDSMFNPLFLPLLYRCVAPGLAFTQLTGKESMMILHNLTSVCTDVDPQISAALAGNLGDNIDASVLTALGNESAGISIGQIKLIKAEDLYASLSVLGSVMDWNDGQARAIIQTLMSAGMMQMNDALSLFMLGSLIMGLPATVYSGINGSQLMIAAKDPTFMTHLMSTSRIVHQTFVAQIISMDSSSEMIIQNVPDEMATEIPRTLLLGLSSNETVITKLNKKKWKRQQVELFFSLIAAETATAALGSPNNLSSSVLQGFTCTAVKTMSTVQIQKLIKACRRKGKEKVTLVETQLTCMYNYIKGDSDATTFDLYPSDMLLYYDYSLVPQTSCRSYFEQLADADFSVFSSALSYKLTALFANARSCLGITSTTLTQDNILVLGNMCCTLDGSYIQDSDPSILVKLKNCPDLTDAQAAAVETLLESGETEYGAPSTWDLQTLEDLGMLPLYMTSTFYGNFDKKTKKKFLKYFLKLLKRNGVGYKKRKMLKKHIRESDDRRAKRSAVHECTAGEITPVTIMDETFPFDYDDITQFNCCLSATTVRDNLGSITEKVDQEDFLRIVLSKLHEAYTDEVPEDQVQLLGPASRQATTDDISTWSITKIDTLSALMDVSYGEWDPSLAKSIITKYLRNEGNQLGSAELNVIGGTNLCSLDVDDLKTISEANLRQADALMVSSCSQEKKQQLFAIAKKAFTENTRSVSDTTYQLIQNYLGGAGQEYVQSLAASDVNMDLETFTSLDDSVVMSLTVGEVKTLLGTNLPELKSYENEPVVQNWIRSQYQSELDTLDVGLQGGKADPTAPARTTAGPTANIPTTASSHHTSTPSGNNGSCIRADAGLTFVIVMAFLITSSLFVI